MVALSRWWQRKAIWAVAYRVCRLTWKIPHPAVEYIEFGKDRNWTEGLRNGLRLCPTAGQCFPKQLRTRR